MKQILNMLFLFSDSTAFFVQAHVKSFPQSDCWRVKISLSQQKLYCSPCDFCTGLKNWGVRDSFWALLLLRHRSYTISVNSKQEWIHLLCKWGCATLVRWQRWFSALIQQWIRKCLLTFWKKLLSWCLFSGQGPVQVSLFLMAGDFSQRLGFYSLFSAQKRDIFIHSIKKLLKKNQFLSIKTGKVNSSLPTEWRRI